MHGIPGTYHVEIEVVTRVLGFGTGEIPEQSVEYSKNAVGLL